MVKQLIHFNIMPIQGMKLGPPKNCCHKYFIQNSSFRGRQSHAICLQSLLELVCLVFTLVTTYSAKATSAACYSNELLSGPFHLPKPGPFRTFADFESFPFEGGPPMSYLQSAGSACKEPLTFSKLVSLSP